MSAETYQVGAHFKALHEAVLMALSKILEIFSISSLSAALCPPSPASLFKRINLFFRKGLSKRSLRRSLPF